MPQHLLRNVAHRGAFWSLIVARVVYAVNWYNIASIFAPMAIELKTDVSGLGILASSFYFGVVLFQIPGGLLAAKYGPRRTSFAGIFLASVSALFTGFSSGLGEAAALRFIVGLGMALFFSPGVSLIARYYRKGSEGFGIGLYNSAFDLGGALGLFGWALLAEVFGWRQSLFFSGGMGIVTSFLIIVLIPKEDLSGDSPLKLKELSDVLLNRELFILSLNILGQNVGSILVGSFIVYYLETALGVGYELAGSAGALFLLMMLAFSPVSGRIYDRLKDARRLLLVSGLVMSAGVGLAAFGGVYGAFAATNHRRHLGGAWLHGRLRGRKRDQQVTSQVRVACDSLGEQHLPLRGVLVTCPLFTRGLLIWLPTRVASRESPHVGLRSFNPRPQNEG